MNELRISILGNLRFAVRSLAKSPAFTAVAVLMLAFGIGSVTAMYSTMRAMVFNPINTPNSDRVVYLWSNKDQALSPSEFLDIRDQSTSFSALGFCTPATCNVGGDHPVNVRSISCTAGVLRAFGIAPVLGRWFEPSDEKSGAPEVAIISYRLWQQSFNSDSNLVGRTIRLDGRNAMVVGIMPADYEFFNPWMAGDCDLWRSAHLQRDQAGQWNCCTIGLLRKGITPTAARAEISAIGTRLQTDRSDSRNRKSFPLTLLVPEMTRYVSSSGWMMFAATVLVLAVACANVGSMLLARNVRRLSEFGVRVAMGAGRAQLFGLVFSESLLLSLAGTGASLVVSSAVLGYFRHLASGAGVSDVREAAMSLDSHAFGFAAGLALLAALLAGIPPAWAALRSSVADLLRTDSRGAAGSASQHRLLRGLVVLQVAVAFVLANVSVLFSTSYAKMILANSRVATEYVLSAQLDLHGARYETNGALARFSWQLAERVAALPGVAAAGITSDLPLEWGAGSSILANNEVYDAAITRPAVVYSAITPGYFAAADIPLLQGRTLQNSDAGWGSIGIVVNRAFVDKYWPGQDPLGKIVRPNNPNAYFHARVVGVVGNVRQWGINSVPQPQLYWTIDHAWSSTVFVVARSPEPAAALSPALQHVLGEFDPDLPLSRIRTFKAIVRDATLLSGVMAALTNFCTMIAIALVAAGLYGTLSYYVQQRTREIGVRVALGATRRNISTLLFGQGFRWVLIGIGIGIVGAVGSARALRALVYDVNTLNPIALIAAAGAVFVAASLACWLPARRAARTDPMEALRYE